MQHLLAPFISTSKNLLHACSGLIERRHQANEVSTLTYVNGTLRERVVPLFSRILADED